MSEMRKAQVQPRAKNVTVIPQRVRPLSQIPINSMRKRRVAAYARVSTDSEEQQTSYAAQIDYYTKYIQAKEQSDHWEFVEVYTDEGISATNTKHRDGFNRMIQDALDGKIDLIITKSVSRFARNTVDSLTTVRKLKERGVEVFFEKENIYTLDSKGELLITIMSSLAQEESRSISENTTWGQRKRFADGKLIMPFSRFLGYRRGANGDPEIVPEEAKVVVRIYRMFLAGYTPYGIGKVLEGEGILTPGGKEKWTTTTINSILTNEKYKGDALLQKTFCTDFITKKTKINEGEVPQYYVENSHPAIVSKEMFEQVQQEVLRRKAQGINHRGTSCFAGKLVCDCCGQLYGRKVWHSNDEHRKVIWRCNLKYKGAKKCETPHITEDEIMDKFVWAYNAFLSDREFILNDGMEIVKILADTALLESQVEKLENEIDVVQSLIEQMVVQNARFAQNQAEYSDRYNELVSRFIKARDEHLRITKEMEQRKAKEDRLRRFFSKLQNGEVIDRFSTELWMDLIDKVVIRTTGELVFCFKNGSEIIV